MNDEQTRIIEEILAVQREQVAILKRIPNLIITTGFIVFMGAMLASAFSGLSRSLH